jgi:hypothetical protein
MMDLVGEINIMENTFSAEYPIGKYRIVTYSKTPGFVKFGSVDNIVGITQDAATKKGDTLRIRELGFSLLVIDDVNNLVKKPLNLKIKHMQSQTVTQ